jgi:hypothetical protein
MAQTEDKNLLDVIREEIEFDGRHLEEKERKAERLISLYYQGNAKQQMVIEEVFECLTGWSFEFILLLANKNKAGVQ